MRVRRRQGQGLGQRPGMVGPQLPQEGRARRGQTCPGQRHVFDRPGLQADRRGVTRLLALARRRGAIRPVAHLPRVELPARQRHGDVGQAPSPSLSARSPMEAYPTTL
jgi:hypothetical protein